MKSNNSETANQGSNQNIKGSTRSQNSLTSRCLSPDQRRKNSGLKPQKFFCKIFNLEGIHRKSLILIPSSDGSKLLQVSKDCIREIDFNQKTPQTQIFPYPDPDFSSDDFNLRMMSSDRERILLMRFCDHKYGLPENLEKSFIKIVWFRDKTIQTISCQSAPPPLKNRSSKKIEKNQRGSRYPNIRVRSMDWHPADLVGGIGFSNSLLSAISRDIIQFGKYKGRYNYNNDIRIISLNLRNGRLRKLMTVKNVFRYPTVALCDYKNEILVLIRQGLGFALRPLKGPDRQLLKTKLRSKKEFSFTFVSPKNRKVLYTKKKILKDAYLLSKVSSIRFSDKRFMVIDISCSRTVIADLPGRKLEAVKKGTRSVTSAARIDKHYLESDHFKNNFQRNLRHHFLFGEMLVIEDRELEDQGLNFYFQKDFCSISQPEGDVSEVSGRSKRFLVPLGNDCSTGKQIIADYHNGKVVGSVSLFKEELK